MYRITSEIAGLPEAQIIGEQVASSQGSFIANLDKKDLFAPAANPHALSS